MLRRAGALAALLIAAVVLTGCFVVSKNLPAGSGPIADERLIGAWRGLDAEDGKEADAFLHFLKPDRDEPFKLVWVEDRNYQVYEVHTMQIGGKNVFAAKILTMPEGKEGEIPEGYYLGFYDVKSADEVVFHLLDAKKVGELIERGRVKGIKPPRQYDWATLTGSPEEIARFLASPEAAAALMDGPAHIRRISRGKNW